ncbi:MAG: branched-chain amino acid ABC transporter permease [Acidimicrobiales bacterium]
MTTLEAPPQAVVVSRSRHPATWAGLLGIAAVVVLALLPYIAYQGFTSILVNLFILMTIATMWNVLAGYAGLVSVGQQAFIGAGAYTVLVCAQHGIDPFIGVLVAIGVSSVLAYPVSFLVLRLAGAYFAIATWVIAGVAELAVLRYGSLGGGTGENLPGLNGFGATLLSAYTYWASLAIAAVALVAAYLLLRSRLGLILTAVRDNEVGARSVGSRVMLAKRLVYVLAAGGCAAAGGMIAISQLGVQPGNVFDVQWTAYMIFAVLIGGLSSMEGPIIGSVVFIVLQQTLSQYNAWYLIILGLVAMAIAIWARGGVWGLLTAKVPLRLFPVGYYVHTGGVSERRGPLRLVLGPVRRWR